MIFLILLVGLFCFLWAVGHFFSIEPAIFAWKALGWIAAACFIATAVFVIASI